jgi:hypothetical protein
MSQESVEYKASHGGARKKAGRKSNYDKTIVMRVPEKYKGAIKSLINHLDDSQMINKDYSPATSAPVFIRSLLDRAQQVTFTVSPMQNSEVEP